MPTYHQLRSARIACATRPYNARGHLQKRCAKCLLASFACICKYQRTHECALDVILIMHRNEILKPTNSGRLISDTLGNKCHVYEWSRTEPDAELLALLSDPKRYCVILFPGDESRRQVCSRAQVALDKQLTLIVLDGTWRQARKMFRQSLWLKNFACVNLTEPQQSQYTLRNPLDESQLSTAQACAVALKQFNEVTTSELLHKYFAVFNENYTASKYNRTPEIGPNHLFLQNLKQQSQESLS